MLKGNLLKLGNSNVNYEKNNNFCHLCVGLIHTTYSCFTLCFLFIAGHIRCFNCDWTCRKMSGSLEPVYIWISIRPLGLLCTSWFSTPVRPITEGTTYSLGALMCFLLKHISKSKEVLFIYLFILLPGYNIFFPL